MPAVMPEPSAMTLADYDELVASYSRACSSFRDAIRQAWLREDTADGPRLMSEAIAAHAHRLELAAFLVRTRAERPEWASRL